MSSQPSALERLTIRKATAIALILAILVSAIPFMTGPFDYALGQLIGSFVLILVVLLGLKRLAQWNRTRGTGE